MITKIVNIRFISRIICFILIINSLILPQVNDSLISKLKSDDAVIRFQTLVNLEKNLTKDQEIIDLMINLFSDPDPYINGKAADIVSKIGKNALPSLIEGLRDSNSNVRWCSAVAFSKMGNGAQSAQSVLITALNDKNENVRWCSVIALGNIEKNSDEKINAIAGCLNDIDYDVRIAASKILENIAPNLLHSAPEIKLVINKLDTLTPELMHEYNVPGVSVALIKNRRIFWTKSFGISNEKINDQVTDQTIYEACSMSKPVFSFIAMKLIEEGKIEIDTPLYKYLDESCMYNQPYRKLITARIILCHSAGFPNWRKGEEERDGPLPILFKPGTKFGYSGEGMFYLQRVIEKITGERLEELADRMLFKPLEMDNSSFVWNDNIEKKISAGHDDKGKYLTRTKYVHANSAYTLYTTAEDYAKFIIEILDTNSTESHSLSKVTKDEMLRRQIIAYGRDPIDRPGRAISDEVFYGLGWGINVTAKGDIFYHSGANRSGFRCYTQFDFEEGSGLVIMTNSLNGTLLWSKLVSEVGDL